MNLLNSKKEKQIDWMITLLPLIIIVILCVIYQWND